MVPHRENLTMVLCFYLYTFLHPPSYTLQTPWLASQTLWLALRPSGWPLKSFTWTFRPSGWSLYPHAGFSDSLAGLLTLCLASLTLRLSGWSSDPLGGLSNPPDPLDCLPHYLAGLSNPPDSLLDPLAGLLSHLLASQSLWLAS